MDLATANLEALAEEDYEESYDGTNQGSEGLLGKKAEPSQFDNLCDGVLNSLALVHSALTQVLDVKDDLVHQQLPPNVLSKVTLKTSGLFRSLSDLHMPVNELIRLVRLYSTPWQEKSTALKKLHEDYAIKKAQLAIAIKKLEMIDAQSKRVQKAQIVMNWEKVFAKLVAARGHGRRWKFLIEPFKRIKQEGPQKVRDYLEDLDEDSSDEEEMEADEVVTHLQQIQGPPSNKDEDEKDSEDEDEDEDDEDESTTSKQHVIPTATVNDGDEESVENKSVDSRMVMFKPPTVDQGVDTNDPEFERYLVVRIYTPEYLEEEDLKCSIIYGEQRIMTGTLNADNGNVAAQKSEKGALTSKKNVPRKYEECRFLIPEGEVHLMKYSKFFKEKTLNLAIHTGPMEEMIAMATVDMQDLANIDIGEVTKPPPVGDEPDWDEGGGTAAKILYGELWKKYEEEEKEVEENMDVVRFPLYSIHPNKVDDSHSSCGSIPLGFYWLSQQIPEKFNRLIETENMRDVILDITGIDLYTTSKEDLNKEMRDEALSAISFTPEVPPAPEEPPEETVSKSEYDELKNTHQEQLEKLQLEYEKRLQELTLSLREAEEAAQEREDTFILRQEQIQAQMQEQLQQYEETYQERLASMVTKRVPSAQHRVPSGGNARSRSASTRTKSVASSASGTVPIQATVTVVEPPMPDPTPPMAKSADFIERSPKQVFKTGKALPNWGEHLPKDFLDRLAMFEDETYRRRQELMETLQTEVSENIEKALASQYKLQPERPKTQNTQDVSLPAVFMPTKTRKAMIYNPRAHNYFHPTGSDAVRLTQPPSMVQLPPLPKNKLSVVNLFQLSNTLQPIQGTKPGKGTEWLMQRYLSQAKQDQNTYNELHALESSPASPVVPVPTAPQV